MTEGLGAAHQRERGDFAIPMRQGRLAPRREARVGGDVHDHRQAGADGPPGGPLSERRVIPADLDVPEIIRHVAGPIKRLDQTVGLGSADPGQTNSERGHDRVQNVLGQGVDVGALDQFLRSVDEDSQRLDLRALVFIKPRVLRRDADDVADRLQELHLARREGNRLAGGYRQHAENPLAGLDRNPGDGAAVRQKSPGAGHRRSIVDDQRFAGREHVRDQRMDGSLSPRLDFVRLKTALGGKGHFSGDGMSQPDAGPLPARDLQHLVERVAEHLAEIRGPAGRHGDGADRLLLLGPALHFLEQPALLDRDAYLVAYRFEQPDVFGREFSRPAASDLDDPEHLFLGDDGHDDGGPDAFALERAHPFDGRDILDHQTFSGRDHLRGKRPAAGDVSMDVALGLSDDPIARVDAALHAPAGVEKADVADIEPGDRKGFFQGGGKRRMDIRRSQNGLADLVEHLELAVARFDLPGQPGRLLEELAVLQRDAHLPGNRHEMVGPVGAEVSGFAAGEMKDSPDLAGHFEGQKGAGAKAVRELPFVLEARIGRNIRRNDGLAGHEARADRGGVVEMLRRLEKFRREPQVGGIEKLVGFFVENANERRVRARRIFEPLDDLLKQLNRIRRDQRRQRGIERREIPGALGDLFFQALIGFFQSSGPGVG